MQKLTNITLKDSTFSPALFLAPMAGITHSAFRRLVADFGGYGALFTEMLSGSALLHENLEQSPFTKRRECEKAVIYQLLLNGSEDIAAIIAKLASIGPTGIDINLGCPAPAVRKRSAGFGLFDDEAQLKQVLQEVRKNWDGLLTIKCRLGSEPSSWKSGFPKRLCLFEECGVDALFVHPRFAGDKLKRRAQWEQFQWIADQTVLPIIGNGDILSGEQIAKQEHLLTGCQGLMLGRAAVVKPWLFSEIQPHLSAPSKPIDPLAIDYAKVYETFYSYLQEDFPPEKCLGRLKEFTAYFARNFFYGHELYRLVQGSTTLSDAYESALNFLSNNPRVSQNISVLGI